MEETTSEANSAFFQPDAANKEGLVNYLTQNAIGNVPRQVDTRVSQK